MKFMTTIYYTLLRNIRDWKFALILFAAPLLTIYITGVSADKMTEYLNTTKVPFAYYVDTGNPDAAVRADAFEQFIQTDGVKKGFEARTVSNFESGYALARNDDVAAFVVFNENGIETYATRTSNPVNTLVQGFNRFLNIGQKDQPQNIISRNAITSPKDKMTQLDMWTYLNTLLFLFYGAVLSAYGVINERTKNITGRLKSSPVSYFSDMGGKIAGYSIAFFVCAVVTVISTALVFGSNWNGNMLSILAALGLYSVFASCFGMVVALIFKRFAVSVVVIMSLNALLFSGSGLGWGGQEGSAISSISPHYYAAQAIIQSIFGSGSVNVGSSLMSLGIMTVVMLSAIIVLGKGKKS